MARRIQWVALLIVAAVAASGCAATWGQGSRQDYYHDFYDDFASHGTWVEVAPYGLVWCPGGASSAWEPYTVGYWVSTDDGWLWISEDPWGSIPYHYGRWAFDDFYGWIWVPGDVWAPAWVAWRYGSGWVGWAPLPPDVSWQVHVGIEFYGYDLDRHIDARHWFFTRAQDFGTHRKRVRVERSGDKEMLLKQTRNVTKYAAGPRPVEEGFRSDLIREIRGKKIERYRIVDVAKPVSKDGLEIRGRDVEVFRPTVDVKDLLRERERVRVAKQRKDSDPAPRAIERSGREREERGEGMEQEKPESRIAGRERVSGGEGPATENRERRDQRGQDVEVESRKEVKPQVRPRVDVVERPIAAKREEAALQREEAARKRDEAAREREEAARKREEAARERAEAAREHEKVARQREETDRPREQNAKQREEKVQPRGRGLQKVEKSTPTRERDVREPDDRVREKPGSKAEARQDAESVREGRGSSKGRIRGS